jgi:hypothetical protein
LPIATGDLEANVSSRNVSKFSPFYTTVINVVFWTLSLIPAVFTIWEVKERKTYPEDHDSSPEEAAIPAVSDEKNHAVA